MPASLIEAQAMRVPRARFTVRTMMIAVAATGVILNWYNFSTVCRQRAATYASFRAASTNILANLTLLARDCRRLADGGEVIERVALSAEKEVEDRKRIVAYWDMMEKKYRRAAASPWLPVEPDPPSP